MARDRNSERANMSSDVRLLHLERDIDELERTVESTALRSEKTLLDLNSALQKRIDELDADIASNKAQVGRLFAIALGLIVTVAASTISLLVGRIGQ